MSGLAEILEENRRLREREAMLTAREAELTAREAELSEALQRKDVALQNVTAQRDAVRLRAEYLEQELALIKLRRSGPASQRFVEDDAQATLALGGDVTAPPRSPVVEAEADEPGSKPPGRRLRKDAPKQPRRRTREDFSHLPSRTVYCPAPKDAACAKCGGHLRVVGKAESFRIGWVPGHYVVEDVVRDKCACPSCLGEGVLTVPAPYAIDKALCADSLLGRVLVDKFADHLPLNRQAARMAREGLDVATSTLSSWVVRGAGTLRLVAKAVRSELLAAAFLQGDDT